MEWPKPENNTIPEGHYVFRLREDPEFETWTFTDKKSGKEKIGTKITFFAIGVNADGDEYEVRESMPVWDKRYADLCAALFVDHGKDIKMAGAHFEGDVIHEPDKKDIMKSWPRITKIVAHVGEMDFPAGEDVKEDDTPF
jgi:hypothetical protein